MVNVVRLILGRVLSHLQHIRDNVNEVVSRKKRVVNAVALRLAHLDVELQAAYAREVELAWVEEHSFEKAISGLHGRRIARAHLAIDFKKSIDRFCDDILLQSLREHWSEIIALREED